MQFTPSRAFAELKAQHAALRGMMERCVELADELDAGRCGPTQLLREIARLRLAFEAHNRFEETQQHLDEHRSLRTRLATHADNPVTGELRQVIESLRAHLEHEEHVFVSGKDLRDDTVPVDGG